MIDLILSRLEKVRKTGAQNWIACCPAHDDRSPSLTLHEASDGRILAKCFAGCSFDEVAEGVGLGYEPWFPPKPDADFVAPIRKPFPAADVLEAVHFECLLVATAAANIANEVPLTIGDHDRLMLAYERISEARRLALG